MHLDVRLEPRFQECEDSVRFVVRRGLHNSLVERERMTGGTVFVVVDRLHVRPAGDVCARGQNDLGRYCEGSPRLAVPPGLRQSSRAMTIVAFQLDSATRRLQIFPQVDPVVEFEAAGIAVSRLKRSEFRMPLRERLDLGGHCSFAAFRLQVRMTIRAGACSGA